MPVTNTTRRPPSAAAAQKARPFPSLAARHRLKEGSCGAIASVSENVGSSGNVTTKLDAFLFQCFNNHLD